MLIKQTNSNQSLHHDFYRDMAVMYPDGTFVVKGRVADGIRFKVDGEVVYPGPIEEVMSHYPGIAEISVKHRYCVWLYSSYKIDNHLI